MVEIRKITLSGENNDMIDVAEQELRKKSVLDKTKNQLDELRKKYEKSGDIHFTEQEQQQLRWNIENKLTSGNIQETLDLIDAKINYEIQEAKDRKNWTESPQEILTKIQALPLDDMGFKLVSAYISSNTDKVAICIPVIHSNDFSAEQQSTTTLQKTTVLLEKLKRRGISNVFTDESIMINEHGEASSQTLWVDLSQKLQLDSASLALEAKYTRDVHVFGGESNEQHTYSSIYFMFYNLFFDNGGGLGRRVLDGEKFNRASLKSALVSNYFSGIKIDSFTQTVIEQVLDEIFSRDPAIISKNLKTVIEKLGYKFDEWRKDKGNSDIARNVHRIQLNTLTNVVTIPLGNQHFDTSTKPKDPSIIGNFTTVQQYLTNNKDWSVIVLLPQELESRSMDFQVTVPQKF